MLIILDIWEALYTIVHKRLELFEQRNIQGKIIILYDEDERIASQAATTMCERGFENLFMLSGGESRSCPCVCVNICMNLKPHSEAFYFISSSSQRLEGDRAEVSGRNDHRLFSRHLSSDSDRTLGSEARRVPPDAAASREQTAFHVRRPQQDPALPGGGAHTQ